MANPSPRLHLFSTWKMKTAKNINQKKKNKQKKKHYFFLEPYFYFSWDAPQKCILGHVWKHNHRLHVFRESFHTCGMTHFSSPAQNKDTYKIEPLIKRVIDKHTENCVNHIFNQIVNFRVEPTFVRVKYVDTFCISKRASILYDSNP